MKMPIALIIFALILYGFAHADSPSTLTFLRCEGQEIINDSGKAVQLRGFNLGNWLLIEPWMLSLQGIEPKSEKAMWDKAKERFGQTKTLELIKLYRDTYTQEKDFKIISEMGLNSVRIPIWWRAISDPEYGGTLDYIDRAILWGRKYNIYIIIDLHGYQGSKGDLKKGEDPAKMDAQTSGEVPQVSMFSDEGSKLIVDWWKEISMRYRDEPIIAGYDIINEPNWLGMDKVIPLYQKIVQAIRVIDQKHIIFLEDGFMGVHLFPYPESMSWKNVSYSEHHYAWGLKERFEHDQSLPRTQHAYLDFNVPSYKGEWSCINVSAGGLDALLRFKDIYDYFGWNWSYWSYKRPTSSYDELWGMVGCNMPTDASIHMENDSFEEIKRKIRLLQTDEATNVHPIVKTILSRSNRYKEEQTPSASIPLSIKNAFVTGGIKWNWTPAQVQLGNFNQNGRINWRVNINQEGYYNLYLRMASPASQLKVAVRVDGTLESQQLVASTGSWGKFINQEVARIKLTPGVRCITIQKGHKNGEFLDLRHAWLSPVDSKGKEDSLIEPSFLPEIELTPMQIWKTSTGANLSNLRVHWTQETPKFGWWEKNLDLIYRCRIPKSGKYEVTLNYSSKWRSTLNMQIMGGNVMSFPVPESGEWDKYRDHKIGNIVLEEGEFDLNFSSSGGLDLRSITLRNK